MDVQKAQGQRKVSNEAHIIKQQVFDVTFGSRERAHGLQDELGSLYNNKLLPLIDEIFTAASAGRDIKLDKLEIDLGGISRENIEQELTARIKEQLRKALSRVILAETVKKNSVGKRKDTNEVKLLEYYLLYGSYPWWVSINDRPSLADMLLSAITAHPSESVAVLKSIGRKAWVRKRLVLRFSEQLLESVVRLLEPHHAQFIIDYSTDLQQLHEKRPAVKAPAQEFREAKWEFILTYLLSERGTIFNTRSFIKSTIAQLSARYNITYSELLTFLAVAVKSDLPFSFRSTLPVILADIHREHAEAIAVTELNKDTQRGEQLQLPLLGYYLVHGSLPSDADQAGSHDLLEMFHHALAHKPSLTAKMVREAARKPSAIKRIVSHFPDTLIVKLIHISEPSNAAFIIDYTKGLQKLQEKEQVVRTSLSEFRKVKWDLVLTHLFTERGSYFNTRTFVQGTLKQLAARYNMKYSDLLVFLSAAINTTALPAGMQQTLPSIIHSLSQEQLVNDEAVQEKLAGEIEKEEHIIKQRDALDHFFRYGKLPWWFNEPQLPTPAQLMVNLVHSDAREVVNALYKAAESAPHHIVSFYSQKLVYKIITMLEPVHGSNIVSYISTVQRLQQERPLIHPRPAVFGNIVMEITLTYLLADRGSHFNTRSYIRYTLQKLAARFSISYRELLQRMGEVLPLLPASNAGTFTKVIAELNEEEMQDGTGEEVHDAKTRAVSSGAAEEDNNAKIFAEGIKDWMKSRHGISFSFENASPEAQELFYFLLNGKWKKDDAAYKVDDLIVKLMQKDRARFREQMAAVLSSGSLRLRLLVSLPEGRIYELIGLLASGEISFLSSYLKDIGIVLSEHSVMRNVPNKYRSWLLEYVLGAAGYSLAGYNRGRITEHGFIRGFIQFMAEKEGESFAQSLRSFEAAVKKVVPELITQLPLVVSGMKKEQEALKKKEELQGKKLKEQEEMKKKELQKKELQRKDQERRDKERKRSMIGEQEEPGDALYISNAGIALMAPYLQRYFEMLGLATGGKFLSDRAAARGAHLLQYLVTGVEKDNGEHELAFNKLLCGLATWWPVESAGTLSDKERDITSQMLGAVLRNWPAMKATTPETFRESFMKRGGRLVNHEKHWTLTVEKKTFDVLLSNLPWSFSTIKFPWMEKVIYTEWK